MYDETLQGLECADAVDASNPKQELVDLPRLDEQSSAKFRKNARKCDSIDYYIGELPGSCGKIGIRHPNHLHLPGMPLNAL